MRGKMRSEHGQATVEWTGLLLLAALALAALSQLAPRAAGGEVATTLAHSLTGPASAAVPPPRTRAGALAPRLPAFSGRARRGVGAVWRKAWFGCLVYARIRYAVRHPESRIPGYTLPYGTALRLVAGCLSPVDLLGDLPELDPSL